MTTPSTTEPSVLPVITPQPPTTPMGYSVAFQTQGCKANQLESSALADSFRANGWRVVPWENHEANLVIFNTCTVTERADAEARRLIRKTKRENPNTRIAVTGCYAQVGGETLIQIPGVDFVIGNNYKEQLYPILAGYDWSQGDHWVDHEPVLMVDEFDKSRELETVASSSAGIDRTRGSLKIQDGCDYKCTYCIIWKGRGPSKSLSAKTIQERIHAMVQEGFKEIVLTGINIGQYQWENVDLAALLRKLSQIDGEFRLRLTSLDPLEVTPDLISAMAESHGKIAPHVHLSAQSAHDEVLKKMARRHHVEEFVASCHDLVHQIPGITLGSDIIVGFPGESDTHFEATYVTLRETPMHYAHVFRYSPRPGTPAAEAKNPVPERIRKERAERLITLMSEKNQLHRQSLVGTTRTVLIEDRSHESGSDLPVGLSDNYCRVQFQSSTVETPDGPRLLLPNMMVHATITDAPPGDDHVLVGTVKDIISP